MSAHPDCAPDSEPDGLAFWIVISRRDHDDNDLPDLVVGPYATYEAVNDAGLDDGNPIFDLLTGQAKKEGYVVLDCEWSTDPQPRPAGTWLTPDTVAVDESAVQVLDPAQVQPPDLPFRLIRGAGGGYRCHQYPTREARDASAATFADIDDDNVVLERWDATHPQDYLNAGWACDGVVRPPVTR